MMISDQNTRDSTPEHVVRGRRQAVAGGEGAAHGIQRAGADVAEHHAQGPQAQDHSALAVGRNAPLAAIERLSLSICFQLVHQRPLPMDSKTQPAGLVASTSRHA